METHASWRSLKPPPLPVRSAGSALGAALWHSLHVLRRCQFQFPHLQPQAQPRSSQTRAPTARCGGAGNHAPAAVPIPWLRMRGSLRHEPTAAATTSATATTTTSAAAGTAELLRSGGGAPVAFRAPREVDVSTPVPQPHHTLSAGSFGQREEDFLPRVGARPVAVQRHGRHAHTASASTTPTSSTHARGSHTDTRGDGAGHGTVPSSGRGMGKGMGVIELGDRRGRGCRWWRPCVATLMAPQVCT